MNTHPYLRAYLAGLAVPSVFLLFAFTFFCVLRFVYNPEFEFERIMVFPLALVPALWGLWNMLYLKFHSRRWPLGLHGAIVPLFLVPASLVISRLLGFTFPWEMRNVIFAGLPLIMGVYYLAWKFLVGYLNAELGIA